jgi:rhamnosyltransferase
MKRICIGIVLYHPSETEINRVKNYLEVFNDVYVYDNTPGGNCVKDFQLTGIHYIFANKNNGMSIALNSLCKSAINDGYDFIITMDQDSKISNKDLLQMQQYINNNEMKDIGIVAPTIIYDKHLEVKNISINKKVESIEWTITSGSAMNLYIYKSTEGFDENYFIDRLDYDYCFALRQNNKKIIKLSWVYLFQELGEKVGKVNEHNSLRNYYMFRNRLYFYNKYQRGLVKYFILLLTITRHLARILLFQSKKREKLKMFIKAFIDYRQRKMGAFKL